MRFCVVFTMFALGLSVTASGQPPARPEPNNLPSVTAEQARQNLLVSIQPGYPALAKTAGIAGVVRVEIVVDETGSVKNVKVISGQPLLVTSALEAVKKWKYRPFQIDGKPAAVRAQVEVSIPEKITQTDIDREQKFQDTYWANERAGRAAIEKGDWATAEARLKVARNAAEDRGDEKWLELADVISMLGSIKEQQKSYPEAESLLKESLAIHEKHQHPDEAEVASAQLALATCIFKRGGLPKPSHCFWNRHGHGNRGSRKHPCQRRRPATVGTWL
jgi:TonB family protein